MLSLFESRDVDGCEVLVLSQLSPDEYLEGLEGVLLYRANENRDVEDDEVFSFDGNAFRLMDFYYRQSSYYEKFTLPEIKSVKDLRTVGSGDKEFLIRFKYYNVESEEDYDYYYVKVKADSEQFIKDEFKKVCEKGKDSFMGVAFCLEDFVVKDKKKGLTVYFPEIWSI